MVQLTGETKLDARTGDDWNDLANSLPGNSRYLWIRFCAGVPWQDYLDGRIAVCHQSRSQLGVYTDSIRTEKHATCSGGYPDRLGNDSLVYGCYLAAQQMGCFCASALLCLGIACHSIAIEHRLDELGEIASLNTLESLIAVLQVC
jgi:hypothetical protein